MVPIITREGIEAFKGNACDGCPEVRPRKDHRGVDLISDALPFGRLCMASRMAVANAIGYAEHRSRSHNAAIRVYNETGNVIEAHEHAGDFKETKQVRFTEASPYQAIRSRERFFDWRLLTLSDI